MTQGEWQGARSLKAGCPEENLWGLWGPGYAFDDPTAEHPPRVDLPRPWDPNKLWGGPELWAPEASWVLGLVCRQREPLKGL